MWQFETSDTEPNLLSNLSSTQFRGGWQDYSELLASDSRRDSLGCFRDARDYLSNRAQACISAYMTDFVVVLLEAIGIKDHKGQLIASSRSICPGILKFKIKSAPIGEAGQLV